MLSLIAKRFFRLNVEVVNRFQLKRVAPRVGEGAETRGHVAGAGAVGNIGHGAWAGIRLSSRDMGSCIVGRCVPAEGCVSSHIDVLQEPILVLERHEVIDGCDGGTLPVV